jgi:hypothetical protein
MADNNTLALAIAGGAISASLLDTLHEKGILDLMETRGVLDKAMKRIGPFAQDPAGFQASQIIADLLKGKYTARG